MKLYIGIDVYEYGLPGVITTDEMYAALYLKEEPKGQFRRVFAVDGVEQMVLNEGSIEPIGG